MVHVHTPNARGGVVALPDLAEVLARVGPGQVIAARPHRVDGTGVRIPVCSSTRSARSWIWAPWSGVKTASLATPSTYALSTVSRR